MQAGRDTASIIDGARKAEVKLLYILGSDPATKYHEPEKAIAALEIARFVVVQDMFLTETAKLADVVLPSCSFVEKDGTFVNIEGREQKVRAAMATKGDSRPDWQILADILGRFGTPAPYFSARDVYREYTRGDSQTDAANICRTNVHTSRAERGRRGRESLKDKSIG